MIYQNFGCFYRYSDRQKIAQFIQKHNFDVNLENEIGMTPLYSAAQYGKSCIDHCSLKFIL